MRGGYRSKYDIGIEDYLGAVDFDSAFHRLGHMYDVLMPVFTSNNINMSFELVNNRVVVKMGLHIEVFTMTDIEDNINNAINYIQRKLHNNNIITKNQLF